jgi:hypothetical protein
LAANFDVSSLISISITIHVIFLAVFHSPMRGTFQYTQIWWKVLQTGTLFENIISGSFRHITFLDSKRSRLPVLHRNFLSFHVHCRHILQRQIHFNLLLHSSIEGHYENIKCSFILHWDII